MSGKHFSLLLAIGITLALTISAHASRVCLKGQKPFELRNDTVSWTMFVDPGSNCIQGLRWSYMRIDSISVSKAPTKGKLVIVGSGFRYAADRESDDTDNFTLVVEGKNQHDAGKSTIEILVKSFPGTDLPRRP